MEPIIIKECTLCIEPTGWKLFDKFNEPIMISNLEGQYLYDLSFATKIRHPALISK